MDLALALTTREQWLGWMPSTTNAWAAMTVTLPPSLLAGAAAWLVGAPRRSGAQEWLIASPRQLNSAAVWSVLWVALAGAVGHVITFAAMLILSSRAAPVDWAGSLPATAFTLVLIIAFSVLAASFGGWVGSILPTAAALPLGAALPYGLAVCSAFISRESPLAALFVHNAVPIAARSTTWVLLAQSVTYAAVAVWLLFLMTRHAKSSWMAWVVSASVAVTMFGGLPLVFPPGAEEPVCRSAASTVCVPRSQLAALDDLTTFTDDALADMPESMRPDYVIGSMPPPGRGAMVSVGSDKVVDRQQVIAMLGADSFEPPCATSTGDPSATLALLTWWWRAHDLPENEQVYPGGPVLAGEGAIVPTDSSRVDRVAVAERLSAMSRAERNRWFSVRADKIRSCSLTAADVR
ncbi:hypothetical protein ASJ30_13700 [Janibacter indicus]|uniref:Uncharacterized protein n=1 Tax=Janibacter indicus TaxID=857417 RepID=A0A1L3MJ73_9MICO|nr:hypothetical protein ASJ30_13700 [Janibacter indicus]